MKAETDNLDSYELTEAPETCNEHCSSADTFAQNQGLFIDSNLMHIISANLPSELDDIW